MEMPGDAGSIPATSTSRRPASLRGAGNTNKGAFWISEMADGEPTG